MQMGSRSQKWTQTEIVFFRSISDQLFGDHGKAHSCVRSAVCDFMEKNEGDFQVFLVFEDKDDKDQEEDARDFEDYIENMRRDGEWGGNLEVVAAARLYQRNVTVYSETLAAFTVDHGDSRSLGSDLLVSYHDNRHYNSVRNKLNPPKPIRVKHPPVNRRRTDTKANNNKNIDQQSSDIEEVTTSLSNLPITDEPEQIAIQNTKAVKRSAPCPCGSGLRYKKCCLAKQKSAARMKKLRAKREADEEGVEDFPVAKGSESSPEMFRVVAI